MHQLISYQYYSNLEHYYDSCIVQQQMQDKTLNIYHVGFASYY